MKRFNNKLFGITAGAFGIIWLLAVAAIAAMRKPALPWAGAVCMELLCVLLSEVYLLLLRHQPDRQATEAGAISLVISAVYLLVTALTNGRSVLLGRGSFHTSLVVRNLILTVVYGVAILFAEKYVRSLSGQLEDMSRKLSPHRAISAKIGALAASAPDESLRSQLLQLKEQVDYSTNVTTTATAAAETEMAGLLDMIDGMLSNGSDAAQVAAKIRQAQACWQKRSSMASGR